MNVRAFAASLLLLALLAGPEALARGKHDGGYLRFGPGLGCRWLDYDVVSGYDPDTADGEGSGSPLDWRMWEDRTARSEFVTMSAGHALLDGLILAADMEWGSSHWKRSFLSGLGVGAGLTWYPFPADVWFTAGYMGTAVSVNPYTMRPHSEVDQVWAHGFRLMAGKDWSLGGRWTIGVAALYSEAWFSEQALPQFGDVKQGADARLTSAALLVTTSFHPWSTP